MRCSATAQQQQHGEYSQLQPAAWGLSSVSHLTVIVMGLMASGHYKQSQLEDPPYFSKLSELVTIQALDTSSWLENSSTLIAKPVSPKA